MSPPKEYACPSASIIYDAARRLNRHSLSPWRLQCPQESDQIPFILSRQIQSERVAHDGARAGMKPFKDVIGFQASGIEPFFQRLRFAFVAESIPEPDASQRGDFVESGASARFEREIGIGSNTDIQNVVRFAKIVGYFEARRWSEFVVRI